MSERSALVGVWENGILSGVVDQDGDKVGIGIAKGRGFAWLTDSRGQQNYDKTARDTIGRPRNFTCMNAIAGQPFDFINNAGVNGDTISGAAARLMNSNRGVGFGSELGDASTAASNAPGINIAAITDVAVGLGYNDVMGDGVLADVAYANLVANVLTPIRALGKKIWLCTVPQPNSAAGGYTAARAIQLALYNGMLRNYAATTQGVGLFDFDKALLSGSSTVLEVAAADFRDGTVHENNRGGYKEGFVAAAVVALEYPRRTCLLPASNAETYNVSTSLPFLTRNPLQLGSTAITTTGYTGSCAGSAVAGAAVFNNANFVRGGSTPSCVLSTVARTDNTGGQNTKMVATWSAAGDSLEHRGNNVVADIVVGAQYEARCEVTFTGPAGAELVAADNLRGVQLYLQYNDGTNNHFSYENAVATNDVALIGSVTKAIFRTRPLTIPAGGTPTTLRAVLAMVSSGATGSPELTFGLISVVRVA